jgi:hypothetical protein
MGTPASIGYEHPTYLTVDATRVNYDGYVSYLGSVLLEHYSDPKTLRELIALGELSSVDTTPATSVAYGRDRGEEDMTFTSYVNVARYLHRAEHYAYLYGADGEWYVVIEGERMPLKEAIEKDI